MLPQRKQLKWNDKTQFIIDHAKERDELQWTTSAGKTLSLPEMDTNHLNNAIAKIKRGDYQEREHQLEVLVTEKIYREVYTLRKTKKKVHNGKRELKALSATEIK